MPSSTTGNQLAKMPLETQRATAKCWLDELGATGRSERTRQSYAGVLSKLARAKRKPFEELTKADLVDFLGEYGGNSQNSYGVAIKAFLKSLNGGADHPSIAWFKPRRVLTALNAQSVLSEEQVRLMIDRAEGLMGKALVHVLYESGARIGELLGAKRRDVLRPDDGTGYVLRVAGKTGERRIRLVSSAPVLRDWLNATPNVQEAPIFPISYTTAGRLIGQAGERALGRPVNPHLLRHSRGTVLAAQNVPESAIRAHLGWTPSSAMVERFIHLSGRDVDDHILRAAGVEVPKRENNSGHLKPVECPICRQLNDRTMSYCTHCSASLLADAGTLADDLMNRFVERFVDATWEPPSGMAGAPDADLRKLRATRVAELAALVRDRQELVQECILRSIELKDE